MSVNPSAYACMGDIQPQKQASANTEAQRRAVYYNSATAFMRKLSAVPDKLFTAERDDVFSGEGPTRVVNCDISHELGEPIPATSPHILARYAFIRQNENLRLPAKVTGMVCYVIKGCGVASQDAQSIEWNKGDTFVFPGGGDITLGAVAGDAILWIVGDEPFLFFQGVSPDRSLQKNRTEIVHYTAAEIDLQLDVIHAIEQESTTAGRALILSSDENVASRNVLPTLTLAYNSLAPGATQRPHRHNSIAISLIIDGEDCYSTVDGNSKRWSRWATTITPACALHSHTNNGTRLARFLIVQDGGLYTHARASGFSFS